SDDMIILRGVNVFPTQIEEQLLQVPQFAPHFQIVLSREGRMDEMCVQVEAVPGLDEAAGAGAAATLRHRIKQTAGISVTIRIGAPASVPRSQGKAVRIIDNRPRG
ncbi:MAG: phenylacetate--CoA ligase, partial [Rhodobacteraceae bacterium]|nr:phenylacetate--CoA ligase [Paracoccaceae bacterium]